MESSVSSKLVGVNLLSNDTLSNCLYNFKYSLYLVLSVIVKLLIDKCIS